MEPGDRGSSWASAVPPIVRITSHVAVWAAVLVPTAIVLSRHWVAVGDDAAISIRSHQTFSLHPPLVGVFSTAGNGPGHYLFDPGPLLFWLLAVPVRIDPRHGALWGAALLGGAALSLAVEASWWKHAWLGCSLVAFTAVDLLWRIPDVFENLAWNAYFPVPFLIASIVVAWVVATGSLGWWPVLVLVASITAQCHLVFSLPAALLALIAPLTGSILGGPPRRLRWLVTGLAVGLACWLGPLAQEVQTGGNLTALVRSGAGQKVLGLSVGLRLLGAAASPSPIWVHAEPSNFFSVLYFIGVSDPGRGIAVLVLPGAIAAGSWLGHRRDLCALALVALACSVGVLVTFTVFPQKNELSLDYLIVILWVLGILMWTVVVWSVVVVTSAVLRRYWGAGAGRDSGVAAALAGIGSVGVVLALGLTGATAATAFEPNQNNVGADPTGLALVGTIAERIEQSTPRGPVAVAFEAHTADRFVGLWVSEGVAWRLEADGWSPGLYAVERVFTGLTPSPRSAAVVVTVDQERLVSMARVRCAPLPEGCTAPLG